MLSNWAKEFIKKINSMSEEEYRALWDSIPECNGPTVEEYLNEVLIPNEKRLEKKAKRLIYYKCIKN